MDRGLIASRYAKALFSTTEGDMRVCARIARELGQIEDQMGLGLRQVLINPLFNSRERRAVLQTLMTERDFLDVTQKFLLLLLERGRMELFDEILFNFRDRMDEMIERVIVTVISAEPLPSDVAMNYGKLIQLEVGHSALLRQVVDPEMIGGAKIIIRNRMIDGTLLGQLERFKEHMGMHRGR